MRNVIPEALSDMLAEAAHYARWALAAFGCCTHGQILAEDSRWLALAKVYRNVAAAASALGLCARLGQQ